MSKPKHTRFSHLKGVFGPWWIAVNGLWTLASSADVLVGHYASASFKAAWDAVWIAPKWGWTVWVIGFLIITVGSAFEYSFRYIRQHETESAQREVALQTSLAESVAENKRQADLKQVSGWNPIEQMLKRKQEEALNQIYRAADKWEDRAKDFQKLPERIRAEWEHRSDCPDVWRILHPGCASLCNLAGTMLIKSPKVSASLSQALRLESDPMFRWLGYLKQKTAISGILDLYETSDGGQKVILLGHLENVAEISYSACIECAAKEL